MNSHDEVVRVAVLADPANLSGSQLRLLDALSQSTLPGFRIDLPGDGVPISPRTDLIHLLGARGASRVPASRRVAAIAREHWIGLVASYPAAPRELPVADCRMILSPSAAADAELLGHGARPEQLWRWQPGVDPESFGPGYFSADILPHDSEQIHVLHVGIPEHPDLLEAAFALAAAREPRLRLVIVDGPADLPALYASADLLTYLSTSPDFPLEIVEAQASGLPVLALGAGAAPELIEDGRNGVLVPPAPGPLAEALVSLARRATPRERLTVGGLCAVRGRTWQRSLESLTAAWTAALMPAGSQLVQAA